MRRSPRRTVLITDAQRSPAEQLRSRQIRYVAMMSIRAVCLVVAAVLVSVRAPLLWLWLPLCVFGMVVVPWLAVIVANDGPPKEKHRILGRRHAAADEQPAPAVTATPRRGRVIDADE